MRAGISRPARPGGDPNPFISLICSACLEKLSEALAWLKGNRIRTAADLATKGAGNPEIVAYVQSLGILKEDGAERYHAPRPSMPFSRTQGASTQRSNVTEHANEHQRAHQ